MLDNTEMLLTSNEPASKRTYKQTFCPEEFTNKFSSKQDLYTYMSEFRKYDPHTLTAVMQSSFLCHPLRTSTATSCAASSRARRS